MTESTKCPCGSGNTYTTCCEPFIENKKVPATPEALMRSRYAAYTKAKIDYIRDTMRGSAGETFDETVSTDWAKNSEWLGLNILKAEPVSDDATVGFVDFTVKYKENGTLVNHHEISEFHKEDDRWFYVDGIVNPKFGRNEPCYCGSGKKLKKCCGN